MICNISYKLQQTSFVVCTLILSCIKKHTWPSGHPETSIKQVINKLSLFGVRVRTKSSLSLFWYRDIMRICFVRLKVNHQVKRKPLRNEEKLNTEIRHEDRNRPSKVTGKQQTTNNNASSSITRSTSHDQRIWGYCARVYPANGGVFRLFFFSFLLSKFKTLTKLFKK